MRVNVGKGVFEYLLQEDPAIAIAKIIPDSEGNPLYREEGNEDIFVRYEFIRGKFFDIQNINPEMASHAQEFLAKLHARTMDGKFVPDKGKRKVDSIIEFDGRESRVRQLQDMQEKLLKKSPARLSEAERLFLAQASFL